MGEHSNDRVTEERERPPTDEDRRQAVQAAIHAIDRALGTVKIQHEHAVTGRQIVVHVGAAAQPGQGQGRTVQLEASGQALESLANGAPLELAPGQEDP